MGTPLRMVSSLPVQHRPTRLMPSAPLERASFTSSSSSAAWTITSESNGLWPCSAMFTLSLRSVPRFTVLITGWGVPNITSDSSVATMEPPQPSDRAVLRPWSRMFT